MKQVRDVMNTDLITIEANLTFDNILKIMTEKGAGKLPVIDNGQLIGVVTRDDILVRQETAPLPPVIAFWDLLITLPENKEFKKKLKKLSGYIAKDIMSTNYLVVKQSDDLANVITQIVEQKYNYALVVENDSIEGIITKTDLIKKCFN
ncbi:CBS domain-containing protein [Psychrilyobacter atlanticus]|uniref:CBS domain-containing protein n=1 Tax=Psychrilyobacter atlanticus TaxID=271091 RepID=UPI00041EBE4A|nr:CBS domain-containing protein [Psychrilyobacter atlanticus]